MMKIEFEIDQESVNQARNLALTEQTASQLIWILFPMPVTLVVGGVAFLDKTKLELLRLAYDGLHKVRTLPTSRSARLTFTGGGGLDFQMHDNVATVTSIGRPFTGSAPYLELRATWEEFSNRVREFLVEQFPELKEHRELGVWFSEGRIEM